MTSQRIRHWLSSIRAEIFFIACGIIHRI